MKRYTCNDDKVEIGTWYVVSFLGGVWVKVGCLVVLSCGIVTITVLFWLMFMVDWNLWV